MSNFKLISDKLQSPPSIGVGGSSLGSHGASKHGDSRLQPSALQQKHLQHIVGTGRNSINGADEALNVRANPFAGSNSQGPLAQKRINTGQRIIENTNKSIRSTKKLPLSSSGQSNSRSGIGAHHNQYNNNNDYSKVASSGIPKPAGSAAHRRSRLPGSGQYNSTSAAGYGANNGQQNRGTGIAQNVQMRQRKLPTGSAKDPSQQLKMAGAASLQRDRDLNSGSELSQIAAGIKPHSSINNSGVAPPMHVKRDFSGKNSIGEHQALASNRLMSGKPIGSTNLQSQSASQNQRLAKNASRSQFESSSLITAQRDSISIDRKPLTNKLITNSQNGVYNLHQSQANTPAGSIPLAQAIYGQTSSNNRNYRGSKSKHVDGKSSLQTKRSLAGPVATSNQYQNNQGGVSMQVAGSEQQRMQNFKNNMKEIYANVKRTEEVLSLIQSNSRNAGGVVGASTNKSPPNRRDGRLQSLAVSDLEISHHTSATVDSSAQVHKSGIIQNNVGISRSRVKGLQNSQSNKRLPTWKANENLLAPDKGLSSPLFDRGINERSVDRASAGPKNTVASSSGGGVIMQSRAQLLQAEYKKVIENHPGTLQGAKAAKYDDTDLLSRMFTNIPVQQPNEPLGLNRIDSSEVLHKSQSMKMIGDPTAPGQGANTSSQTNMLTASAGPVTQPTIAQGGSVAARMLARKQNLLNSQQDAQVAGDYSSEARKITVGSKETRKLTNRADGGITSGRNQKSQVSNQSMESEGKNKHFSVNAISEFKPMPNFMQNEEMDDLLANDDDIRKIARLQLINASARFELLSANQQLIDFHLNRVMNTMFKKQDKRNEQQNKEMASNINGGEPNQGAVMNPRLSNLLNMEKSVIHEVSETEENNTTHMQIGRHFKPEASPYGVGGKADRDGSIRKETEEAIRDRNRDSMFGTMLLTSGMSKENEARRIQIQHPHHFMQQRLSDMHPLMFGDTIRLPVLKQEQQPFAPAAPNT